MRKSLNNASISDPESLRVCVLSIAEDVSRRFADEVDQAGRFPIETIDALRANGLLSAGVPSKFGGGGLDVTELAHICTLLGSCCSSSAMIVAMHYSQVDCLVSQCGGSAELGTYLQDLARAQRLIASVTSEVGTDGDLLRSLGAIQPTKDDRYAFTKQATTISYGNYADDLLVTLRRDEGASKSDQVLVLSLAGDHTLEQTTEWDTLGMRGTCSPGATVKAVIDKWQVFDTPFQQIAAQSMIPVSYILWSAVWVGIAQDAVATARRLVQKKACRTPSIVPQGAGQLAALDAKLQIMRSDHQSVMNQYDSLLKGKKGVGAFNIAFSLRLNNLKISASRLVHEIVVDAIQICGIAGYRNNSEFSLGRQLRDSLSAPLMISNNRILDANAKMQLVYKGSYKQRTGEQKEAPSKYS